MIKRPQRDETEEDILRMQNDFFAEKAKNPKLQPAAKMVKIEKAPKKSLFAQSRLKATTDSNSTASAKTTTSNSETPMDRTTEVLSEIQHKIVGDVSHSNLEQRTLNDIVLGDIVEKKVTKPKIHTSTIENMETATAFPKVERSALRNVGKSGKSIYALSIERKEEPTVSTVKTMDVERKRSHDTEEMQWEPIEKRNLLEVYGEVSIMVEDNKTAAEVHKENLEILSKMQEEEILEERKQLLESIDPTLVALLVKRRQQKAAVANVSMVNLSNKCEQTAIMEKSISEISIGVDTASISELPMSSPAIELLERSNVEQWIHFDVLEKDKLEWMRDIPTQVSKLKPGQRFEARFDWKGVLLPYSTEETTPTAAKNSTIVDSVEKDERELYLHGDEPHRPGYTLQELFRLARSNVMQQRVSAFGAIAGILNIYNQGFYDNVLELPVTKIFFLLRFGLDDNTPAMLELVTKALAYLFYNETDETLLDFTFDNPGCHWQPTLQVLEAEQESEDPTSLENLQKQMRQLQVNAAAARSDAAIKANVDETEEESKMSMSDFQLAETNLVDCLIRTNILQRIYFILDTIRPENSTVSSCLKLLIRLARTGKEEATAIVNNEYLIKCLFDNFLPGLERVDTTVTTTPFYNYPQYLCLKLMRILISQNLGVALKLINLKIVDKLENFLYNREDIKGKLIKIQIESLRIVRCLMLLRADNTLHKKFLSAFRYMLEWHFNHVIYDVGGPFLIRQHAAALLTAIASGPCNLEVATVLGDILNNCCCNWFHKATTLGVTEFSQATLLGACLNAVTWFTRNCDFERFRNFNEKYLRNFIASKGFVQFVNSLVPSSIILRSSHDRRNVHAALPNTGSVIMHNLGPQLVFPQTYCVYMLSTLWRLLQLQLKHGQRLLFDLLIQPEIVEPIVQYLLALTTRTNYFLAKNFYAKSELRLIYMFLCFDGFSAYIEKSQMLQISYNFLCCLTAEFIPEIEQLFERIIFNREYINADEEVLKKWLTTSLELVYPHYIVVPPTELTLSLNFSQAPVLPRDWPYFQLKIILQNYIENVQQKPVALFSEREVILMTFRFVTLLEESNSQLLIVTPTEKLMYLMIAFMGPDAQFLEVDMQKLLREYLLRFYAQCEGITFEFDAVQEGKCKFENLYALFVDHFQAASYGDELFGSLVLVPLAQKYDNKWRRRVWSDYAAALRFLNCSEDLLIGGLPAYLEPPEDEVSLVKAYANALHTNLVRPNTLPYEIAKHHVDKFKARSIK